MKTTALIDFYRQFDPGTDPGPYTYMYKNLPRSWEALCDLVQNQLVHPWNGSEQPKGRRYEPRNNYRVQDMLAQLEQLNGDGLVRDRMVDERVLACCRENALLLTSILRYQDTPSRVRAGWVKYVSGNPDKYADHWVSEVWHEREGRWVLVDTNPKRIDFPGDEFQSGGEAWLQLRSGHAAPEEYRTDSNMFYVKMNFGHDFNAVLGTGPHYWEAPPLFHINMAEMTNKQLALLDHLAELLRKPDQNMGTLQTLQMENEELQGVQSAWPIFERTTYR